MRNERREKKNKKRPSSNIHSTSIIKQRIFLVYSCDGSESDTSFIGHRAYKIRKFAFLPASLSLFLSPHPSLTLPIALRRRQQDIIFTPIRSVKIKRYQWHCTRSLPREREERESKAKKGRQDRTKVKGRKKDGAAAAAAAAYETRRTLARACQFERERENLTGEKDFPSDYPPPPLLLHTSARRKEIDIRNEEREREREEER